MKRIWMFLIVLFFLTACSNPTLIEKEAFRVSENTGKNNQNKKNEKNNSSKESIHYYLITESEKKYFLAKLRRDNNLPFDKQDLLKNTSDEASENGEESLSESENKKPINSSEKKQEKPSNRQDRNDYQNQKPQKTPGQRNTTENNSTNRQDKPSEAGGSDDDIELPVIQGQ